MRIDTVKELKLTEVGIPYENLESFNARIPWDLKVFEGYLYVGAGDYNKNISPIVAKRYSLTEHTWQDCGAIPDEEINRFLVIDGKLVITGTDPTEDWNFGNYYVLDRDSFQKKRTIPGGIHNFDLVEFNGGIFAGLGVISGEYPVSVSYDKGETFSQVPFMKNGEELNTNGIENVRVYNLIVYHSSLYAILYLDSDIKEVYKYQDGEFVYENDWARNMPKASMSHVPYTSKSSFFDEIYFSSGYFCVTNNMKDLTAIRLEEIKYVTDTIVYGEKLFVLGYKPLEDGTFVNYIYEKNYTEDFKIIAEFEYNIPACSFDYYEGNFWFGFGRRALDNIKTGLVAYAEYTIK